MNCNDLIPLLDAYLDSELDARTTWEIRSHLSECPHCSAAFNRSETFARQLAVALARPEASPELWGAVERQLTAGPAPAPVPAQTRAPSRRPASSAEEPWWRYWLWPAPRAYAALAVVWALLFALELSSRLPSAAPVRSAARPRVESSDQARLTLLLQRQLRAELLDAPAGGSASIPPLSPQSRTGDSTRWTSV